MSEELTYKSGAGRGLSGKGWHVGHYCQHNVFDYLADLPDNQEVTDLVEVQFKNTRKGYYHNINHLEIKKGDCVAVEASPGHDIGIVTLTGRLAEMQMLKARLKSEDEIKRLYRIATDADLEKYEAAKKREHKTSRRE